MFLPKRHTISEIHKPAGGADPAYNMVRHTARKLSILGEVQSQRDFAINWLDVPYWQEDDIHQRYSNASLEYLSNSLGILAISYRGAIQSASDDAAAWGARNRTRIVDDLLYKIEFICSTDRG